MPFPPSSNRRWCCVHAYFNTRGGVLPPVSIPRPDPQTCSVPSPSPGRCPLPASPVSTHSLNPTLDGAVFPMLTLGWCLVAPLTSHRPSPIPDTRCVLFRPSPTCSTVLRLVPSPSPSPLASRPATPPLGVTSPCRIPLAPSPTHSTPTTVPSAKPPGRQPLCDPVRFLQAAFAPA